MRVTIEDEVKEQKSFFSRKPAIHMVHVTLDVTHEELALVRSNDISGMVVYREECFDVPGHFLDVILASLIVNKPHTLKFHNGGDAARFKHELKTEILPAIKAQIELLAQSASTGPETFEL